MRCKGTMFFLYLQIFLVKKCKKRKNFLFYYFLLYLYYKYNKDFYLLFVPKNPKNPKFLGIKSYKFLLKILLYNNGGFVELAGMFRLGYNGMVDGLKR